MSRERLTITLRSDLLKVLDNTIDGDKLRNRSHAIEFFLSKSLSSKDTKVLILAGGKHADFQPFKGETPKAMVEIGGKPLLEHTLNRLKAHNLKNIVISVGQAGKSIRQYFGDGEKWELNITYLEQDKVKSGTARPLLQAKEEFKSGSFLLLYGDVLTNINFTDLIEFHRNQQNIVCTMALSSVERVSMWGLAKLVGSKIMEYEEKPEKPKTHSHLVNSGVYVMEPVIFKYILENAIKLESDVFPRLAEEGRMAGYPFEGLWFDIGNADVYKEAVKVWR
jgi:mannose-1-phosphate guanylyltransferase